MIAIEMVSLLIFFSLFWTQLIQYNNLVRFKRVTLDYPDDMYRSGCLKHIGLCFLSAVFFFLIVLHWIFAYDLPNVL